MNMNPSTTPPSPQHYWNKATNQWQLRKGIQKKDPAAEFERVEHMRIEASFRPPRTGRPPSNAFVTMSQSKVLEHVECVLNGEVVSACTAPRNYPPAPRDYDESERRLREVGLDEVLALVEEGHSEGEICERLGTRPSHLKRWVASTPEGESRAREARVRAAQAWLDRGLEALEEATTLAELAKAREIAQICRRYAAIYNPTFSDRVQIDTTIKAEDPESIDARLRLLVAQVVQTSLKQDEE